MSMRVGLVGHCGPDSSYLRMVVTRAVRDVQIVAVENAAELDRLIADGVNLLLFNRLVDYGFEHEEGVAIIRDLRASHPELRMMLVSNYPEAQAEAEAAGALPGFGKRELGSKRTTDLLRDAIAETSAPKTP